jgi:conserved oligomeric Golgi complex subunit 2
MRSVQAMRAHPVHLAFERRWQLPVYFQLRWKEIVVKLEDVLLKTRSSDSKGVSDLISLVFITS